MSTLDSRKTSPLAEPLGDGLDELIHATIGAAIEVHKNLGPGFTDPLYAQALAIELTARSIPFQRDVPVTVTYKGQAIGQAVLAFVINKGLVVDVKTLDLILPIHSAQLMAHLKAAGFRVGLLMNFKSPQLRDGIKRVVRNG